MSVDLPHPPPASQTWTVQNIATLAGLALTMITLLTLVFRIGAWQAGTAELPAKVAELEAGHRSNQSRILVLETDRGYTQAQYASIIQRLDRIEQRQQTAERASR